MMASGSERYVRDTHIGKESALGGSTPLSLTELVAQEGVSAVLSPYPILHLLDISKDCLLSRSLDATPPPTSGRLSPFFSLLASTSRREAIITVENHWMIKELYLSGRANGGFLS